jgi:hypothetical protein
MIKTFRGLITDGGQDTIVLHTNDGATGYRIVKFQIMAQDAGTTAQESTVKIFKIVQSSITSEIDFSDNTLLAAAYWSSAPNYEAAEDLAVIFEREVFNQDIYLTHVDTAATQPVNYYLELEQIKLDLSESTVATLKDIRNVKTQGF